MENMNIGIDPEHRAQNAEDLKHLLADSYTLYPLGAAMPAEQAGFLLLRIL